MFLKLLVKGGISLVSTIAGRKTPFVYRKNRWSIGIYTGDSPLELAPSRQVKNPVLTAADVTDIPADIVADPFMVNENDTWYMFFEVLNKDTQKGDIGYATSTDGFQWIYGQIILHEPFHLSYPYVFRWQGEYYLIPESCAAGSIRLYKALHFPTEWSFIETMLEGEYFDASPFYYDNRWWLFAGTSSLPGNFDTLKLYFADNLTGPWSEHPESPIAKGNPHIARPGGRVIVLDDRIIRFAQDDYPYYGNQIRAFEITGLSVTGYEEREINKSIGLKKSGRGWNAAGMHHVDAHHIDGNGWIASVDGFRNFIFFDWRRR
jgi:hypothetical protein